MEENNQKKNKILNKKTIIAGVIAIILILMIIITFSVIKSKKKTNAQLSNISNMGLAVSGDEGVFYNKYEEGIVKVKGLDESQITNETAYSLNLVGDEIYYLGVNESGNISIKKVKTNGSGMDTIKAIRTSISKMYVENGYIYYASNDNNGGISKISLDGTEEKMIISSEIRDFEVIDGKIYFSNKLGDLYVATTTGIEAKKINPAEVEIKEFQIKDEWIYYFNEDEKTLYRIKNDGNNNQEFSKYVNSNIYNVSKDRVFFFDGETKKIASVNFNGDNYKEVVSVSTNKTKINIVGDTMYYLDASNDESKIYQMYRVKTDGRSEKKIEY